MKERILRMNEDGECVPGFKITSMMTEEKAALLDKILLSATKSNPAVMQTTNRTDMQRYVEAGRTLKELGMGTLVASQEGVFLISDLGLEFIRKHTFMKLYKESRRRIILRKVAFWVGLLAGLATIIGVWLS